MALPDHKIMLKQLIRDGKRKVKRLKFIRLWSIIEQKKRKK